MLYWNADKTTVDRCVFRERLAKVIEKDEWIIDGNYAYTMEERMLVCDTVFFLDYPLGVCLGGIESRKHKVRSDMPWIETEVDTEFIEYVKSFTEQQRPQIFELFEKYADKNIHVFTSREEADEFLNALCNKQ